MRPTAKPGPAQPAEVTTLDCGARLALYRQPKARAVGVHLRVPDRPSAAALLDAALIELELRALAPAARVRVWSSGGALQLSALVGRGALEGFAHALRKVLSSAPEQSLLPRALSAVDPRLGPGAALDRRAAGLPANPTSEAIAAVEPEALAAHREGLAVGAGVLGVSGPLEARPLRALFEGLPEGGAEPKAGGAGSRALVEVVPNSAPSFVLGFRQQAAAWSPALDLLAEILSLRHGLRAEARRVGGVALLRVRGDGEHGAALRALMQLRDLPPTEAERFVAQSRLRAEWARGSADPRAAAARAAFLGWAGAEVTAPPAVDAATLESVVQSLVKPANAVLRVQGPVEEGVDPGLWAEGLVETLKATLEAPPAAPGAEPFELAKGVRALVLPEPGVDFVSVGLAIEGGAAQAPANHSGVAHVVRALVHPEATLHDGEITLGLALPPDTLDAALASLAARLSAGESTPAQIEAARAAALTRPSSVAAISLEAQLGRPAMAPGEGLISATPPSVIQAFHAGHVVRARLAIVLGGAVDPRRAVALLERHFAQPRDALAARPLGARPALASRRINLVAEGTRARLRLGWRVKGARAAELEVLAQVVALSAGAHIGPVQSGVEARGEGSLVWWAAEVAPAQAEAAMGQLRGAVERIRSIPIDEAEVAPARARAVAQLALRLADARARAAWLATETLRGRPAGPDALDAWVGQLERVNARDIGTMAKATFDPAQRLEVLEAPKARPVAKNGAF